MVIADLRERPGWSPSAPGHPCRAWSEHAADLASGIEPLLERWPATPVTERMIADGLLRPIARGVHLPPRWHPSAPERAVALGCALGEALREGFVIAASSAAWVHVGGPPPRGISVISPDRPRVLADVRVRQAQLHRGEVEAVGGCPVTAPARTALDVLRFEPGPTGDRLVRDLVASGHLAEREMDRALRTSAGRPHVRTAENRWEVILSSLSPHRPC